MGWWSLKFAFWCGYLLSDGLESDSENLHRFGIWI